jgi:hypothetical protein
MPRISAFYGITVYMYHDDHNMYHDDHNPPHFHAF